MERSRFVRALPLALAAALALSACGEGSAGSRSDTSEAFGAFEGGGASATTAAAAGTTAAASGAATGGGSEEATSGGDADRSTSGGAATTTPASRPAGGGGATPVPVPPADRQVIVTVTLDLTVDDVSRAGVQVATLAEAVGGYVQSQQAVFAGDRPSSTIVVKVPPAQVSALLTSVAGLGTVTNQTQAAEDVTAQVVDLDSRIATARASVARVRQFLDRTTDLGELADLEAELTRRETELEQLVAAQQGLAARAALATVTIGLVRTPVAVVDDEPESLTPGRAFRSAGEALAAIGTALVIVVAFALPFLPVALVAGLAFVALRRRSRRAPAPLAAPVAEPAARPAAEREPAEV